MEEYIKYCLEPLYRFKWIEATLTEESYIQLDKAIKFYLAINDKRLWM